MCERAHRDSRAGLGCAGWARLCFPFGKPALQVQLRIFSRLRKQKVSLLFLELHLLAQVVKGFSGFENSKKLGRKACDFRIKLPTKPVTVLLPYGMC